MTQTAKQLAEPRPDDLPGVGPRGLPRAGSALAGLGSGGGRLQAYVHALGGRVHLVAELPGRDVEISPRWDTAPREPRRHPGAP